MSDLLAYASDVHVDGAVKDYDFVAPDVCQDLVSGADLALVGDQECQQLELLLGEFHLFSVDAAGLQVKVQAKSVDRQRVVTLGDLLS